MSKQIFKIGSFEIDLSDFAHLSHDEQVKLIEGIYFEGYQHGKLYAENNFREALSLDSILKKNQISDSKSDLDKEEKNQPKSFIEGEKIEINFGPSLQISAVESSVSEKMTEMADRVYRFKKNGYVVFRMNGTEEEYLKGKFGFTHLPWKATVYDTEEEAKNQKDAFELAGFEELHIKMV